MKKIIFLSILMGMATTHLMAQFPFSTSSQTSGLVNLNENGGVNYEFTSSGWGSTKGTLTADLLLNLVMELSTIMI